MLTIQLTIKGASYNLLAIGDDDEREAFINLCYNWHIISHLPEYDNEPLKSDRKRLFRGLLMQAMSKHEVLTNQMRHKAYRGKATRCIVEVAHTVKMWLNWKRVNVVMPEETLADTQEEITKDDTTPKAVTPSIAPVSVAMVERSTPKPSKSVPVVTSLSVAPATVELVDDGLTEFERELLADSV